MEKWIDCYGILQVEQMASQEAIERSYKRLCKLYHPDLNGSPAAEESMKMLNVAYDVLGDARKRKQYNTIWAYRLKNAVKPSPAVTPRQRTPSASVKPTRPADSTQKETPKPKKLFSVEQVMQARQMVHAYFLALMRKQYVKAYERLSARDQENVTLASFVKWQASVGDVYTIDHFSVGKHEELPAFFIEEGKTVAALRFVLDIQEENILSHAVNDYSFHKITILEQGNWRMYLGYRDLEYVTGKFKFMASTQEEAMILSHWNAYKDTHDLTKHMLNEKGFLQSAQAEIYRYTRYSSTFSIALLRIEVLREGLEEELKSRILVQAGEKLRAQIRPIDTVAAYGEDIFALLLAQTPEESARGALDRLCAEIAEEVLQCFDARVRLRLHLHQYQGEDLKDLLELMRKDILGDRAESRNEL